MANDDPRARKVQARFHKHGGKKADVEVTARDVGFAVVDADGTVMIWNRTENGVEIFEQQATPEMINAMAATK